MQREERVSHRLLY
jgi:hypothetical protein